MKLGKTILTHGAIAVVATAGTIGFVLAVSFLYGNLWGGLLSAEFLCLLLAVLYFLAWMLVLRWFLLRGKFLILAWFGSCLVIPALVLVIKVRPIEALAASWHRRGLERCFYRHCSADEVGTWARHAAQQAAASGEFEQTIHMSLPEQNPFKKLPAPLYWLWAKQPNGADGIWVTWGGRENSWGVTIQATENPHAPWRIIVR